jgi:hypothetical protein
MPIKSKVILVKKKRQRLAGFAYLKASFGDAKLNLTISWRSLMGV